MAVEHNKGLTTRQMYGETIPNAKMHEPGKYTTPQYGNVITKAPIHKAPIPTKDMKPK